MDRVSANLAKLEAVWDRAQPMLPTGPARGSSREYEDLRRAWSELLAGLPPIDSWNITEQLPDADAAGQAFIDYAEIGEHPFDLLNRLEAPGAQLDEYRFRLGRARRRAIRTRLGILTSIVSETLPGIAQSIPRDSTDKLSDARTATIEDSISEVERLLGDTTVRKGSWGDLHRHLHFGQGPDWHDILEKDWPSVRADIEAASLADADPLPVPEIDLGRAASAHPSGAASTELAWSTLNDDGFERLLFDLIRTFPTYQNVQWLLKTRAPDRGRDLSAERVIQDDSGTTRTERVIIQAKHWLSKSVGPAEVSGTLSTLPLLEPPPIHTLVIATSGRFTSDAAGIADKHNAEGKMPHIELWSESRLESLLSARPDLVASHGLRP
ncbi:restriction endonuclease [Brachybacterium paraconglomeratum]|uniref:restriction endonuclease n=1 Tax=Brachybacterium paraconglomeratum TaxID=173362 RepID=UPI0037C82709